MLQQKNPKKFVAFRLVNACLSNMDKDRIYLTHLKNNFAIQSKLIIQGSSEVHHHPSGKYVHDLRIAICRVRAIFWVIAQSARHQRFAKIDKTLKTLGLALGRIREIDVAILDAIHFHIEPSRLMPKNEHAIKKLNKLLSRCNRQNLKRMVRKAESRMSALNKLDIRVAIDALVSILKTQKIETEMSQAKVHKLRIHIKKARYALEAMGAKKLSSPKLLQSLKGIQDILGRSHDLEVLQSFFGKNKIVKAEQIELSKKALRSSRRVLDLALLELRRF